MAKSTVGEQAARGALWLTAASIAGRVIGLAGTLVITRYIASVSFGEVSDALILAMTAGWLATWGFSKYAMVKGRGEIATEVTWHATVAYIATGAIMLGAVAIVGDRLVGFLNAPNAAAYVPWVALAMFIRRLGTMPELVLTRALKFRPSALTMFLGEIVYAVAGVAFAMTGHGGWSIVYANLLQSTVVAVVMIGTAGIASWATPTRLRFARFADMFRFGAPLGVQAIAHQGSRYWDNLAVSHYFGPAAAGAYQLAYNLADIPATQVGEQMALVLTPSMAELKPSQRPAALERSTALLSLIIFPLAVGLGVIAGPLIGLVLPNNGWQLASPLLAVLACLSIFRPITWVLASYFEVESKTGRLMFLEVGKIALLLGGIAALSSHGVIVAAGAVGMAFGLTAIGGVLLVMREGPSPRRLAIGFLQPLGACVVMTVAAVAARTGLHALGSQHRALDLVAMILVGAAAYIGSALALAPATSRDLIDLLRRALHRGR